MRTCLRNPGKGPGMVSDGVLRLELDFVQQRGRELGLGIPGWGTTQAGGEEGGGVVRNLAAMCVSAEKMCAPIDRGLGRGSGMHLPHFS